MQMVAKRAASGSFTARPRYSDIIPRGNRLRGAFERPRSPLMPDRTPRPILPGLTISPQRRAGEWLRRSTPGRILLAGLVLKIVDLAASAALGTPRPAWVDVVDTCGTLGIIVGVGVLFVRGLGWMRRRLLWRVRRKLILSYVFVGLVPSLLIVTFFVLAGLLLVRNVAGYMVQTRLEAQAAQARFLAQTVLLDVQRATSAEAVRDTLERQQASASRDIRSSRSHSCRCAASPVRRGSSRPTPAARRPCCCRCGRASGPTWRRRSPCRRGSPPATARRP